MHREFPRVEIDVADLSSEEYFALMTLLQIKPETAPLDRQEYRAATLGMPRAEQDLRFRIGFEGLLKRKAVYRDTKDGEPISVRGAPQYIANPRAKFVTRLKHVDPKNFT